MLFIHDKIKSHLSPDKHPFDQMMALQGACFRRQPGRVTQRVLLGEKYFFIKQHLGVGWKEIFKNLFRFCYPVLGAKNEWLAIQKLNRLHIPTAEIVAFGQCGMNPATKKSFILLEELPAVISLEELTETWSSHPPAFRFKQKLIVEIARLLRTLHQHGINHRDCYLCHFLLERAALNLTQTDLSSPSSSIRIYVLDLHRAQLRNAVPKRWRVKDLAGLYFSSKHARLTHRDYYRFIRHYSQKPLREWLSTQADFWQYVKKRGEKLYRDHEK